MPKLVIDTNMLVVFVIGSIDRNLLGIVRRVKEYNADDYVIIFTYISLFSEVTLLPNIVSEASNLLRQIKGGRTEHYLTMLAALVQASDEVYVRSNLATNQPEYMELGITDSSILCALNQDTYLLTADLELYLAALCRRQNAQYFQELRD